MQFCRSRLFVLVERYLWKTERYIRGKQAWFSQLKLCFNSFCRLKNIWTTSVSQYPGEPSCSLRFSGSTWGESVTIPQQQTFPLLLKKETFHFQNDISLKTMRLGVLPWEKLKTSWDSRRNRDLGPASLGSRRAIADLFGVMFIAWTSQKAFMLHVPLDSIIESVIAVGGVLLWVSSVCWDTQ